MSITQKEFNKIESFHNKFIKKSKIKDVKFRRVEKLFKKYKKQINKGQTGGMKENNDQTQEAIDHTNQQLGEYQENNNTTNEIQIDPNSRIFGASVVALYGNEQQRERATNAILGPMENEAMADNAIRGLLAAMVIAPTSMTYFLFEPLRNVTRRWAQPPQAPQTSWCDSLPNYICNSDNGLWQRLMDFGSGGLYRFMYAVSFVGDIFDRLLGLGAITVTVAVGFTFTFAAIMIWRMHSRGVQIWFFGTGVDTRDPNISGRQGNTVQQRLTNTRRPNYVRLRNNTDPANIIPPIRPRRLTNRRARSRGATKRQLAIKAKAKKSWLRKGDPALRGFKFDKRDPNNDGSGTAVGGRRKSRRRRRRKSRKKSRKKRKTRKRRRY